jgi:hypothetical protein
MIIFQKNMIDLCFKTIDGQRAFFAYGKFGRGRIVDTNREAALRRFLARWFVAAEITLIAMILLQNFIGVQRAMILAGGATVLLIVIYCWSLPMLLKDAPRSDFKLTGAEIRLKQAQTTSAARLILLMIAGILLTVGSAFSFWMSLRSPNWDTAISGFGILFFGAGLVLAINMIRLRRSHSAPH